MNGAVQGVATTVASRPLRNEPAQPSRPDSRAPAAAAPAPISNTPKRFRPTRKNSMAARVTSHGLWNWKPQPSIWPPARSPMSSPAMAQKDTRTPAENTRPCANALCLPAWAWRTRPRTFSDRTGRTQGMRLSRIPPRNARARAASRPAASPALPDTPVTGASMTKPRVRSPAVIASTPCSREGNAPASRGLARTRLSSPPLTGTARLAEPSTTPLESGKKAALESASGSRPDARRRRAFPRTDAVKETDGSATGTILSAPSIAAPARGSTGGGPAVTGRTRESEADPGTHSTLHASHVTRAVRVTRAPGASPGPGVTCARRTVSPSYPKVERSSSLNRRGTGHCSGPAVKPSGRSHCTVVARPESPGFFQYVCQPWSMTSLMPTVNGSPGRMACRLLSSSAVTGPPRATGAASAGTRAAHNRSARVNNRHLRESFEPSMLIIYYINGNIPSTEH